MRREQLLFHVLYCAAMVDVTQALDLEVFSNQQELSQMLLGKAHLHNDNQLESVVHMHIQCTYTHIICK